MHHTDMANMTFIENLALIIALVTIALYLTAAYISVYKRRRPWPISRTLLFVVGVLTGLMALAGHLAESAHHNFTAHMMGHLLLGMLAPVLMAFGQPMTLLMRTLKTKHARNLSLIMRSQFVKFISNPITASILNIGGLYLLYMTNLFHIMHESTWIFVLVHLHVFLAGYLFTISIIYVDITAHRYSFTFRAIVLILALGFHKVLTKLIYANPMAGFSTEDIHQGAMLMYYGGDIIDLILIITLCYEWYRNRTAKVHVPGY